MRKVILIASAWACLLFCGTAQAHTTITCDPCSFPYQAWVDAARVPTPDVTLAVVEHTDQPGDPCVGPVLGCTNLTDTIWLATWPNSVHHSFLHELGHNFAALHPWIADPYDETFADEYSICAHLSKSRILHARGTAFTAGDTLLRGSRLWKTCRLIRI